MAVSKKNPNSGHRQRVRKKFRKNGFDGFLDYEILEMLLFYCIPVIDTKELAKDILKKYSLGASTGAVFLSFEICRKAYFRYRSGAPCLCV